MANKIVWLSEFKRRAGGQPPSAEEMAQTVVRAAFTAQVVKDGDGKGYTFILATGDTNRNGWKLNPKGWHLDNFKANPVFLWAHTYDKMPIGKCDKVWVEGELLKIHVVPTPAGAITFNDSVWGLYDGGYLRAVSAGWLPIKYAFVYDEHDRWTGEIECEEQELLEASAVPVPAEPRALQVAAAAGIDVGPVRAWARELVGEPRYLILHEAEADPAGLRELAQQFQEFYPGAKAMLVPNNVSIEALDDLAAVGRMSVEEFEARIAAVREGHPVAGVSPRNVSTELADKGEKWSAPGLADFTDKAWGDLTDDEKRKIAGHYAWSAEMPPAAFGSLKLPHHRASDGKVVWKGCTAAMARCMQSGTDIPDEDRKKVYNHLAAHYRAFEEEPPEFASAAVGTSAGATIKPTTAAAPSVPSTVPAAGTPAATDEPGDVSAALARYTRRLRILDL